MDSRRIQPKFSNSWTFLCQRVCGYRLLSRVPRLPEFVIDRLVDHFGDAQRLLAASIDQLQAVDGIGDTRARSVRDGLSRMVESNFR